ncbi:uncharacterized protein LOC128197470 [Vigna angularis]|uniref:uncharacterized protein LOC128197470 n=1 Tax=Phaseolus angularis TaxID=3914 RepID=UPI0022B2DF8A|nr:uncharacterized protein LOC128197470 [Vigna angularis]
MVKFVDDSTSKVQGVGDVVIRRKNGSRAILTGVLFVPAIRYNLLSIGHLIQKGFTVVMGGFNKIEVFDKKKNLILRSKISKDKTFQINLVKFAMCEESGKMNTDTRTGNEEVLVHVAMFAGAEPFGQAEALNIAGAKPIGQTEALKKFVWKDPMREEVDSVRKNGIWKLVGIPIGKKKKSVEGNAAKEAWGVTGEPRHGEHRSVTSFSLGVTGGPRHGEHRSVTSFNHTRPQQSFNRARRHSRASNWQPHSNRLVMSLSRSFELFGLGRTARASWHLPSLRDWQEQLLNGLASLSVSLSVLNRTLESAETKEERLSAFLTAARNGITEIVSELRTKISSVVYETSPKSENVLLVAVKNKQVNVVEMLRNILKKETFDSLILERDNRENTVLHLAAGTSSNQRAGTTMQMIWDIKWYQYISGLVPKEFIYRRNKDDKTAWEIYELEHIQKVKDCSEALKDLSNSGSVVAALIAGISFATSTTVPGSTDNGKPILGGKPEFDVFSIASLIGLGFSITALVMFLAILTSPKQVQHFHLSLPLKLIFGLGSLFASVASMLVSFWAAHFFVLNEKYNMILLPVYVATWFPITIYALMQFPFYVELVRAIFKKVPRPYRNPHSFVHPTHFS